MNKRLIALTAMTFACLTVSAQDKNSKPLEEPLPHKVENIELLSLSNEPATLPKWGEKHLLIFYVDPDRHNQNHEFTVEIEENHAAGGDNIYGLGILNLGDTRLPNGVVRSIARKRTEKNGATILADTGRMLAKKWKLGDCNNQFVLMLVSRDGELVFCKKGELSEADKAEFYDIVKKYR